jgi:hypothetical protein
VQPGGTRFVSPQVTVSAAPAGGMTDFPGHSERRRRDVHDDAGRRRRGRVAGL